MVGGLRAGLRRCAAVLRAIVGVPDYERYVAHMRASHPNAVLLSPREFFAVRQRERFERPGGKCC
jgi:uncharacterized short protein YbdD (DUF466 family)